MRSDPYTQADMVKAVSDEIYDTGITAFAIGVGQGVSTKELDYISHGDRNKRFMVRIWEMAGF